MEAVFDTKRRIAVDEAQNAIPGPQGERSQSLFEHGSLLVKVYSPKGHDPQSPHSRDEACVVIRGSGVYVSDAGRQTFGQGDFLFAPAGIEHRFEDFSDDLVVWVLFYGPQGGERQPR